MKPVRSVFGLCVLLEDKKNKITFYQKVGEQHEVVDVNGILNATLGMLKHMTHYGLLYYTEEKIKKEVSKKKVAQ